MLGPTAGESEHQILSQSACPKRHKNRRFPPVRYFRRFGVNLQLISTTHRRLSSLRTSEQLQQAARDGRYCRYVREFRHQHTFDALLQHMPKSFWE